MLAHCNSVMYTTESSSGDTRLSDNFNRNNVGSRFSRILHDPECQNQCCSNESIKIMHSTDYSYDLEELLSLTPRRPFENFSTENITTVFNDAQVPEVPEFRSHFGHVSENLEMTHSYLWNNEQAAPKSFAHFCNQSIEAEQSHGNNRKGSLKRKRKRTVFTTEQIVAMESVFKKRPYVTKEERLLLTQKLNISEKAIKVWFQNRRRATEKCNNQSEACDSDSTIEEIVSNRLDYIESQIYQTTDEYGFVTLDENMVSEIVNVIDIVLTCNVDSDNYLHEKETSKSISNNYLMYEPISPESLTEENSEVENIPQWIPSEPGESFQRLIDIQTVLFS